MLLANGTKGKLRNLMSAVFRHAMRYEWMEKNSISLVRFYRRQFVAVIRGLRVIAAGK